MLPAGLGQSLDSGGQPHTPLRFSTQPVLSGSGADPAGGEPRLDQSGVGEALAIKNSSSHAPPLSSPLLTEAPELQVNN